jgi:hypothetical protein
MLWPFLQEVRHFAFHNPGINPMATFREADASDVPQQALIQLITLGLSYHLKFGNRIFDDLNCMDKT